ncbi:hypothetical protein BJ875DRAFT_261416 [Amylocarpus encephaloides]|uniref:Myb-like domain-containing protein n=1 Tax=Amylocarpus encephaloides TaxID=45428 RepID=A0A9P8C9M8_9HELO|nr:hypothetical protein BJ875DRAFT_261416 [Amylocarpus encephaloides]
MSGYRPGHEQNQYIEYAPPDPHPEDRVFGAHPDIQHGAVPGLGTHGYHEQTHQQQQQQHHPQQPLPQHQPYPGPLAPEIVHHQSPQYGGGMMYGTAPRSMQPATGTKRQRPDDDDLGEIGLPPMPQQMGEMMSAGHMQQQPMVDFSGSMHTQQQQQFHAHGLPQSLHPSKRPRGEDPNSSMLSPPSGGAPSVLGHPGMPEPALRPRGPKLKFTPEDDQKLVDLKENKNLTWKQIAEFFPGRSSGTLQVRYCTKLKAKTTQWTDETVQKLRTALHDYEQEKWRIIAQKVGTGFTSAACKDKAMEL